MTDPLQAWWRHEVTVERFLGNAGFGDEWDTPVVLLAAVDDRTRQVVDTNGAEQASSTTVVLPRGAGFIRPGSKVTLPATHGQRKARVISCRVADGGGQPTPDHVEVNLE